MKYRKYDPEIKRMIIETGRRDLFPELNIPRTTINYWLKDSPHIFKSNKNYIFEKRIERQNKVIFELKAKNLLVQKCLEELTSKLYGFEKKTNETRKYIIELIDSFRELLPLKEVVRTTGISISTYYRWRVEAYGCKYHQFKKCVIATANQLTQDEQKKLINMAQSPQFRKFSTQSLMYYCKRKNILNASLESWYKYLKLYGIERKPFKRKRKRYKNGLRAKNVNEIWHIDITEIRYGEGAKAYLQLLIDNYFRAIIAWKLSHNKKMDVTYKTIKKSFHIIPDFRGKLICDAGTENMGKLPRMLLIGRGIKQLVAKKDIRFSNSMVEAVFRQFKQKFYLRESKSYKSLYQLIYKFVSQYNQVIPHTILQGGTPIEILNGTFDKKSYNQITRQNLMLARSKRRQEFYECYKCTKRFLMNPN